MFTPGWFEQRIRQFLPDLAISQNQLTLLFSHFELLNRWNQRMDLTSVDTPEEIVPRHYCESLFLADHIPEVVPNISLVDFGSGAGFPGLPIAVLRPEWRVTLLEANQRRAVFLKEASRQLPNISVVAQRGEQFHQPCNWVVARAVNLGEVLDLATRIAPRVGLMVNDGTVLEPGKAEQFAWPEPVRIPWSQSRCCLFGNRAT